MSKIEINLGEFADNHLIYSILLISISAFALFKTFSHEKSDSIIVNTESIQVVGNYSIGIPFNTVSEINMKERMPEIYYRSNGISFRSVRKGYFKLKGNHDCFMSINNIRSLPIIEIQRKNDIPVYLNCKTSMESSSLFIKLDSVFHEN